MITATTLITAASTFLVAPAWRTPRPTEVRIASMRMPMPPPKYPPYTAMKNCATTARRGLTCAGAPSARGFRKKLPQANTTVAKRMRNGTRWVKTETGVARSSTAPAPPPSRLVITRVRMDRRAAPETRLRPARPVVTWPGKSAIVEAMLAARGSSPA